MIKICVICSKFFPIIGGGETHTFQIAKTLSEKKFKVTVITNNNIGWYPRNLSFEIKRINGFDDKSIDLNTSTPELYRSLVDINPDIIHIHNYEPYLVFSLFADSFKDKKVFLTIHNTPLFPKRVFGTFRDFDAEFATARHLIDNGIHRGIIVASKYYKSSIEKIATTPQNINIISYGVDFKLFDASLKTSFRKKLKLSQSDKLIVCPSRIITRKGIKEGVESLFHLPKKFKLFLPTTFEPKNINYFKKIKHLINHLKLEERVILADKPYTYYDMPYIYQASDIVIIPSYYEGFGFAVLEAMAMKKPVIGTNVVGLNEAIKNEEDGLLILKRNSEMLSNAILRLDSDRNLRDRLVKNAFRKVLSEFDLTNQVGKLILLYKS